MLDVSVNIVDDVLQEELARASDETMKNVVATFSETRTLLSAIQKPIWRVHDTPGQGVGI